MNIKDLNRLSFLPSPCCLFALWVADEFLDSWDLSTCSLTAQPQHHHQRYAHGWYGPLCVVWGLHAAQSITVLCLWFLTLPEGSMTNGPTCEALYVKVTMAITLEGLWPSCQAAWCLCACVLWYYLLFCVGLYCAYLRCTMLISLRSSSALSCLGSSHQHRWYIPAPLLPTSLTLIHWLFVLPIHLGQHRGRKDTWRHMAVMEQGDCIKLRGKR